MNSSLGPPLPSNAPQLHSHVGRRMARLVLRMAGWKLVGQFPDVPRLVLIAAPHTSWWDGVWGMLLKVALGLDISFMGKKELFRGPLGWLLRQLGGIPIQRDATHGVVAQMTERFQAAPQLWLGISPEGTRKPVQQWRSGFWHIARAAQVPILPVYFHYPEKTIGVGELFHPGADIEADIASLRALYRDRVGRHVQ